MLEPGHQGASVPIQHVVLQAAGSGAPAAPNADPHGPRAAQPFLPLTVDHGEQQSRIMLAADGAPMHRAPGLIPKSRISVAHAWSC